jgi:hypothetical protein
MVERAASFFFFVVEVGCENLKKVSLFHFCSLALQKIDHGVKVWLQIFGGIVFFSSLFSRHKLHFFFLFAI